LTAVSKRRCKKCARGFESAADRERGRREFTWLVGDSTTPSDLRRRLIRLGAQPGREEPVYAGMVLTEAPPAVEGIEVRAVATFEEYTAVRELG
jgi:hypothetical protein